MRRTLIVLALVLSPMVARAAPSIEQELDALRPVIGAYPPAVKTTGEKAAVVKRYNALKLRLDKEVNAHPEDLNIRYQRATLEDMGHNLDIQNAFDQAKADYSYVLDRDDGNIPAKLGLATLLVNTNPAYAADAEKLFISAQCESGNEPLEEAQRGLFFAHYYQGKIPEAKERSSYLVKHWPNNQGYRQLDMTLDTVLARTKNPVKVAADPDLETCKAKP